jgi:hypothetical protein
MEPDNRLASALEAARRFGAAHGIDPALFTPELMQSRLDAFDQKQARRAKCATPHDGDKQAERATLRQQQVLAFDDKGRLRLMNGWLARSRERVVFSPDEGPVFVAPGDPVPPGCFADALEANAIYSAQLEAAAAVVAEA